MVFHWGYNEVQCAAKGLDLLWFTFPFDFHIWGFCVRLRFFPIGVSRIEINV